MGVSFNFPKFDPKHSKEIQLQGDATITDHHIIRLTKLDDEGNPLGNRIGRVLFFDPVHLYDHSGFRAGFETTFIFRISKPYNTDYTPGPADELLLLNLILFPIPSLIPIIPTYNSAHKKLTVHVSTYLHTQPDTLTYDVDLSTKLPEKVKVGLSASTGRFSQNTEILSWIFKSN
ncbi:agglutinin-2-like [Arachis hypogaea]|uniref:agglutinin-2-like n=1 Tax=Arachis hypogaea TaxID=3818 RepID=UPI000DEC635E|nr:agglutinin-2-like [Arachis hypogaea]